MKMSAKKVMSLALAGLLSVSLMACSGSGSATETQAEAEAAGDTQAAAEGEDSGEKKVLRVAMECAYAPYNWTQPDDSNGAVPISESNEYAYGYLSLIHI